MFYNSYFARMDVPTHIIVPSNHKHGRNTIRIGLDVTLRVDHRVTHFSVGIRVLCVLESQNGDDRDVLGNCRRDHV
jgi:hypothetical protein